MTDQKSGADLTEPKKKDIAPVSLTEEMERSYLDYAMSVIVSRALPDARDGLKPVHRRILFAMSEGGFTHDKPYRKSARIVGDVIGKYHPHGDVAVYDAAVRMAQSFSMSVPLIDGQGNFGSVDGDSPAAMRYTEARMAVSGSYLLSDIELDTVDFQPTYDESGQEPKVLPARFPNLLVNGANGIAVGMATNIPPHNPCEVIDGALYLLENPEATLADLLNLVPGPDFPTGGIIVGTSGVQKAYATGRGGILVRAVAEITEIREGRSAIIVTEIPYQVNKATLITRIAELVREKKIEGISDLRDESDRDGMRIVIELKRDATPEVVLNHLYRFTDMQSSVSANMLALDHGRPRRMGLSDMLQAFLDFREEVVLRRSRFELNKARDKAHLSVGLAIAVANIDEVIKIIRGSANAEEARKALTGRAWPVGEVAPLLSLIDDRGNVISEEGTTFLTEAQARGILELRLQRLTGLEQEKIRGELQDLAAKIRELLEIIASHARRTEVIKQELLEVRAVLDRPRRTKITEYSGDQDDESLIEPGQMVVTITRDGYIKRTPAEVFRTQNRGGRGRSATSTRGDDVVSTGFIAHTHQWVMFFSSGGKAYREKIWRLPEAGTGAKGRALVNFLPGLENDRITAVLPLPQGSENSDDLYLLFATDQGGVRRNRLSDFRNIRSSGLIAMKLEEGEHLIGVNICREGDNALLATKLGRVIRFPITDEVVRVFSGRSSTGVRGIKLARDDVVISLSVLNHVEASSEERAAYLKSANIKRRAPEDEAEEKDISGSIESVAEEEEEEPSEVTVTLSDDLIEKFEAHEEFILTVTDKGYGKRSSAYEYRVSGRGGLGIAGIKLDNRNGSAVVGSFPVKSGETVMLVTDAGQLIRAPVDQVRITGRTTRGVIVLRLAEGETVSSVFPVFDEDSEALMTENAEGIGENLTERPDTALLSEDVSQENNALIVSEDPEEE